jgi:hypothetical protein
MQCSYPYRTSNNKEVRCGRCMPCRISRKRMWTGRMIAEAAHSPMASLFITLTYNNENLPENASLSPRDLRKYIDTTRKTSYGKFRYFAVGEYGDKSFRPHYHMIAFNVGHSTAVQQAFAEKWNKGFTHIEPIMDSTQCAGYVAAYCTKKMTTSEDPRLKDGMYPEFARQSRNPPIGAPLFHKMVDELKTEKGSHVIAQYCDVPSTYRIAGKIYPIDKYWKNYLRTHVCPGIKEPGDEYTWMVAEEINEDATEKEIRIARAKQIHEKYTRRSKSISRGSL